MQEKEILQGIADTITGKPFTITIPIICKPEQPKRTLLERLLRKPLPPEPPKERVITISPCVVANMYRVAGRACSLPEEIISGSLTEAVLPLIPVHLPNIVYIVAAGIQNDHLEPDPELITFIERNFEQDQLFECMYEAIEGLKLQSFLNSIVLAKGTVKILQPETSPNDGSELIASHTAQ